MNWLFKPQNGYPSYRQAEETVVMYYYKLLVVLTTELLVTLVTDKLKKQWFCITIA